MNLNKDDIGAKLAHLFEALMKERVLQSTSDGVMDLSEPWPSPALLLLLPKLDSSPIGHKAWFRFGGRGPWIAARARTSEELWTDAREEIEEKVGRLLQPDIDPRVILRELVGCQTLCELMETMATGNLRTMVDVDSALAKSLVVKRINAAHGIGDLCHETIASGKHYEVKSITGFPKSYCYTINEYHNSSNIVALGGVCLTRSGPLGDTLSAKFPAKMVVYESEWLTPWAALLCIIGALNTFLMIVFLAFSRSITTSISAFIFLAFNVATEVLAIGVGWHLQHRWKMGWMQWLVIYDPFHAVLTTYPSDSPKVDVILLLEAIGGLGSAVGLGLTDGVPLELLFLLVMPLLTAAASRWSTSRSNQSETSYRTPLVLAAMTMFLLEFAYEIAAISILDDSILGIVAIASCVVESLSLVWVICTILYAVHIFHSMDPARNVVSRIIPARLQDGTISAYRLDNVPTAKNGLMGVAAMGSSRVWPGHYQPNGAEVIKPNAASFNCNDSEDGCRDGWLSLQTGSPQSNPNIQLEGEHTWACELVVFCAAMVPVINMPKPQPLSPVGQV